MAIYLKCNDQRMHSSFWIHTGNYNLYRKFYDNGSLIQSKSHIRIVPSGLSAHICEFTIHIKAQMCNIKGKAWCPDISE